MPEGPEIYLASCLVNNFCHSRIFCGKIVKSAVSTKNPDVNWSEKEYTITSKSRGKELMLTLTSLYDPCKTLDIVFRFGMSGKFAASKTNDLHKHAHLQFFCKSDDMVLSFIDYRRFGRWEPNGTWGKERGPCVLFDYKNFRANILSNLDNAAFNRPICEALLNQTFFNGIGNYLRAEILFRCDIAPFVQAREVLEKLPADDDAKTTDILQMCSKVALEVTNLSASSGYDPEADAKDHSVFTNWLQCYNKSGMKNAVDSNKRTIWFHGAAGPMAPTGGKSWQGVKRKANKKSTKTEIKQEKQEEERSKYFQHSQETSKSRKRTKETKLKKFRTSEEYLNMAQAVVTEINVESQTLEASKGNTTQMPNCRRSARLAAKHIV